jgi:ATP-dependent DNA ligase
VFEDKPLQTSTRAEKPPVGPDWVHEIKHDGYRLQVRRRFKDFWRE